MKIPVIVTAPLMALIMTTSLVNGDAVSATYPGRCVTNKDCETYGKGLACIAVDSNIAGLEKLNMCIPTGTICSGSISGICPTFSSWPSKYRRVQPLCAFLEAPNCNKKIEVEQPVLSGSTDGTSAPTKEVEAGDSSQTGNLNVNTTVECYTRNFTSGDEFKVVNGIYQCMDVKKYYMTNAGHLQKFTEAQITSCGGNIKDAMITLCNSQGTCAPKEAFSEEYACICNKGFDGDKMCATVTSNECSNLGQCGALGTCKLDTGKTSGTCSCKTGSTGNQCNTCDASKGSAACSDNGKCGSDGVCTCDSGYTGTFCSDKAGGGGSSKGNSALLVKVASASVAVVAAVLLTLA